MRAQRETVQLLRSGGADPDDVMIARAKYQGQLNEYSRFCKKMGLTEECERIYYDMRGKVAPGVLKKDTIIKISSRIVYLKRRKYSIY